MNKYQRFSRREFIKALKDKDIRFDEDMRDFATYLLERDNFLISELNVQVLGAKEVRKRCDEMMRLLGKNE